MNRDILIKGVIFVAGAAIGSVVTWKALETKYKKITEEEIESVKEAFSKKDITMEDVAKAAVKEGFNVDISVENHEEKQEKIRKAQKIIEKAGYVIDEEPEEEEEDYEEEDEDEMSEPYVITPEEFGDSDYPAISLTYYTDGVVTNDRDKIVSNVAELVGEDFADHFGEYEEDSVFVRNEEQGVDYEILRDYRAYSEIDE